MISNETIISNHQLGNFTSSHSLITNNEQMNTLLLIFLVAYMVSVHSVINVISDVQFDIFSNNKCYIFYKIVHEILRRGIPFVILNAEAETLPLLQH